MDVVIICTSSFDMALSGWQTFTRNNCDIYAPKDMGNFVNTHTNFWTSDADADAGQGGGKMEQGKRRHLSSGDLEGTSTVDFCPQVIMMAKKIMIEIIKIFVQISHQPRRLSGKLSPCPEMQPFAGAIFNPGAANFVQIFPGA